MSSKCIFLTGSTGFLGTNILKQILLNSNSELYLLIRGSSDNEVEQRGACLLKKIYNNSFEKRMLRRLHFIKGEIEKENLGIDLKTIKELSRRVDEIYHCAAMTGFRIPLPEIKRINVRGTKNVLEFAKVCRRIKKVNYISTMFIAGDKEGIISEDDLDVGQNFNNTYEQTKFAAELLANKYKKEGLKISIFRPSIIVGDYHTGETSNFKMFYEPLHFFSLEIFDKMPVDLEVEHNLIPVDVLAKAIFILSENEKDSDIYNIISPQSIKCYHFMDLAANFFKYKNPKWIKPCRFNYNNFTAIQKNIIGPFIPYFSYKAKYIANKTEEKLRKLNFKYPEINEAFCIRLFKFCYKAGFIKKKSK